MFRFRWIGNLLDETRSCKDHRRRKQIRPMLESLEERLTPSGGNPTVTQAAGGYTALTSAIKSDTAANTNYVIQITNNFTFNSGGQVSISKLGAGSTLTIEGQNGNNFTLTGNGNRLFAVGSGQNVTFADLTLTGGTVTVSSAKDHAQGGAIEDLGGNVTLSKMIVQGNTVKGGRAQGGGVYSSGAGALTIRDTIFSDNRAQGGSGAEATIPNGTGGTGGDGQGGGLYVSGSGLTVTLIADTLSGNTARGGNGGNGVNGASARTVNTYGGDGGAGRGGGLYVGGTGWTVTLIGDTLSGNTALGGNGGNGAAGRKALVNNAIGGSGGSGGFGGAAGGGAAFFTDSGDTVNTHLTILNDPAAPTSHPSRFLNNSAQAGNGGDGGAGGISTGTADDPNGGSGGGTGGAEGGAVAITGYAPPPPPGPLPWRGYSSIPFTVNIGNTAFYGNKISSGYGGEGGAPGTGSGKPGQPGANGSSGEALGGGLFDRAPGNGTVVNCTVANNTSATGPGYSSGALGGGIDAGGTVTLDNNTITQNTLKGAQIQGSGVHGAPNLFNNIIQGNDSVGASASDLDTDGYPPNSASNNFIGTISANSVSTSTNIVGNSQMQLGSLVGVDANGNPSGGPIYYPLLPGAVAIGAGSTSVLTTIAGVEGTTPANATDEIGNPLSSNGAINLGAVQIPTPPPPSQSLPQPPAPSSAATTLLSAWQLMAAITLDVDALIFRDFPPVLSILNAISEQMVGQPLPPTADLVPTIEGDISALVAILLRDVQV